MRWAKLCAAVAAVGLGGALFVACASGENASVSPESDGSMPSDGTTTGDSPLGSDSSGDATKGNDGPTTEDTGSGGGDASAGDAQEEDAGCPSPTTLCIDVCVDLQNNPFNCGACNRYCSTGFVCSGGACVYNCPTGQTLCSAFEGGVPDAATGDASASDAESDAQRPDAESDAQAPGDAASADAETDGGAPSGLYCATLPTDPNNCNGCGVVCPTGHDTPSCVGGVCGIASCDPGFANCDGFTQNGCEVNTGTDPNNCGTCGKACSTLHGAPACTSGTCTVGGCQPGFAHCASSGTDCETNTGTDPSNCGACGNVCSTNNDTPSCTGGTCILQCAPGFGNCDGNPANGCETSLNSVANCGSCGDLCTTQNGTPTCNTATNPPSCAAGSCSSGYADCPGDGTNCSTFIGGSDPNNCGACNKVCGSDSTNPNLHDSGSCVAGACTVGTCDHGWADCDGNVANGCETPIDTVSNCGACGVSCSTANGTPACNPSGASWTCAVASCNAGFADCPGDGTNCSTNTTNDDSNCGTCGDNCNAACGGAADHVASTQCVTSKCGVLSCNAPWVDFDGQCADGCECDASTLQTACNNATSLFAGTLTPGQSITPYSANMGATGVTQAWFTLTFSGNTNPSFHPKISISSANNEFVFDVDANCSGTNVASCTDGSPDGLLAWEVYNVDTNTPIGSPEPLPGSSGQVWIRVYRRTGATPTCNDFTITASD